MKKFIAMMLCIVLAFSLFACGNTEEPTEPTTEPTTESTTAATEPTTEEPTTEAPTEEITEEPTDEMVEELTTFYEYVTIDAEGMYQPTEATEDMLFIQSLYEGIPTDQIPGYFVMAQLTPDLFETDVFVPYVEGMEAVRCEPGMMAQAHSVVMLTVPEGTDVESLCNDIKANANPRKWICVEAEMVEVVSSGNTILLVMADAVNTPIIVDNFNTKMAG